MAEVVRNPELVGSLVDQLVAVWVAVTDAGGAVGFTPPVTAEEVRRDAAEPHLADVAAGRQDLVIAREDGSVVAFGFLGTVRGPAVKSHLGVIERLQRHPAARGRGLGSLVLAELEACARDRGLRVVALTARAGIGVERFYQAHGYRLDGRLPDRLQLDGHLVAELHLSKRLDADDAGAGEGRTDARAPAQEASAEDREAPAAGALLVTRLDPELPLPQRAHPGDAGLDLHARTDVTLKPGERALVPTGVAVALPPGTVGLLHPRSGLALRHGVGMVNAPGTVDEGYRGELQLVLVNLDPREPVTLRRGDRVGQLLVQQVAHPDVVEVDDVGASSRGTGGFGSSGR